MGIGTKILFKRYASTKIYLRIHTQPINLNLSQDQLISKWVNTTDFDGSIQVIYFRNLEKDHGLEFVRYKALQDL